MFTDEDLSTKLTAATAVQRWCKSDYSFPLLELKGSTLLHHYNASVYKAKSAMKKKTWCVKFEMNWSWSLLTTSSVSDLTHAPVAE